MSTFFLVVTSIGGFYSIIKILYDMAIGKTWKEICKSHEFYILIAAVFFTFVVLFPWSEYKIVRDKSTTTSAPDTTTKTNKVSVDFAKNQSETVYVKSKPRALKRELLLTGNQKTSNQQTLSSSKYDLRNATLSQTAVGDNAKVEIYEGLKQRLITDQEIYDLIRAYRFFKRPISVVRSNDAETGIFYQSIIKALNDRSIKIESDIIAMMPFTLPVNPYVKGLAIDTSENKFLITIGSQVSK